MLSPMKRLTTTALLLALAISLPLVAQRLTGQSFVPALAGEPGPLAAAVAGPGSAARTSARVADTAPSDLAALPDSAAGDLPAKGASTAPDNSTPVAAESLPAPAAPNSSTPVAGGPLPAPEAPAPAVQTPRPAPTLAPAPAPAAAPTPAPTVAPVPIATPTSCPATWFCYPRVGISGPIVPYSDCSGATDIGTSIRSFTCLSPFYLMGHAYTQFGQITQWRAGDVVSAWGRQFTITGAFVQSSCQAPAQAIAPLSLQTSLTSGGCGNVLVVQGR